MPNPKLSARLPNVPANESAIASQAKHAVQREDDPVVVPPIESVAVCSPCYRVFPNPFFGASWWRSCW